MHIEPQRVATILIDAPAWAKIGLMDRDSQMRERAAETLAAIIADKLAQADAAHDDRQLGLL